MKIPELAAFLLKPLFFLVVMALCASCANVKDMEYRGFDNVGFGMMPKPTLSADVRLFNPNNYSVHLQSASVEVFMDGKKAGQVEQKYDIEVPKKSEFKVPVQLSVSMRETGLLGVATQLLSGKSSKVQFKGEIEVRVIGIPMKVAVDHTEEIKIGK